MIVENLAFVLHESGAVFAVGFIGASIVAACEVDAVEPDNLTSYSYDVEAGRWLEHERLLGRTAEIANHFDVHA
jgi:ketopantoate reductase